LDILKRGWSVGGRKLWCFDPSGNAKIIYFLKKSNGWIPSTPTEVTGLRDHFSLKVPASCRKNPESVVISCNTASSAAGHPCSNDGFTQIRKVAILWQMIRT
jgi:hypothetical protein